MIHETLLVEILKLIGGGILIGYCLLQRGRASKFESLISEIRNGNVEDVEALIRRKAPIHLNDEQPLFEALVRKNERIVIALLNAGANPSARNEGALRFCAKFGLDRIICQLSKRGADINCGNGALLRIAAIEERVDTVKTLVRLGAETKYFLQWAVAHDHSEYLAVINERSAIPETTTKSLLIRAVRNSYFSAVRHILRVSDQPAKLFLESLTLAVEIGNDKMVSALLTIGKPRLAVANALNEKARISGCERVENTLSGYIEKVEATANELKPVSEATIPAIAMY